MADPSDLGHGKKCTSYLEEQLVRSFLLHVKLVSLLSQAEGENLEMYKIRT